MNIDPLLLEILACPCEHHAPVEPDTADLAAATALVCTRCATTLPGARRHPGDAPRRGDPRPPGRRGGAEPAMTGQEGGR